MNSREILRGLVQFKIYNLTGNDFLKCWWELDVIQ